AYLTGRKWGRTKLIEWLSPKKTVEGFAGGILASMLVALAGTLVARGFGGNDARAVFPTWKTAIVFGFLMAVIGQAGDLLESLMKRDAQLKDSGSLVPEFGGALDILDSLLLTAPVAFWMLV